MTRPPAPWTLSDLHARVEAVLAAQVIRPESGRVRAVPDERTLRYYTTLGLLAAPTLLKGRTAYYDRLHLAQIIAIKRLQALGLSLSQVQQELAGATPGELEALAALPDPLPEPPPAARAFWAEPAAESTPAPAPRSGTWLELAPGLVVLLPPGPVPTGRALAALAQAAAPLAEELRRQARPTGVDHD